jgi:hypothetical protein
MKKTLDKNKRTHYINIKQTIDWNKRLIKQNNKKQIGGEMIRINRGTSIVSLTLQLEAMPIILETIRSS